MRKFFIAAILLAFTTVAFAQSKTPFQTASSVFYDVQGTMFDDCRIVSDMLLEDTKQFDFAYCGGINDGFTTINKILVENVMRLHGYRTYLDDWVSERFAMGAYRGWVMPFSSDKYWTIIALVLIPDPRGGTKTAVMIVTDYR